MHRHDDSSPQSVWARSPPPVTSPLPHRASPVSTSSPPSAPPLPQSFLPSIQRPHGEGRGEGLDPLGRLLTPSRSTAPLSPASGWSRRRRHTSQRRRYGRTTGVISDRRPLNSFLDATCLILVVPVSENGDSATAISGTIQRHASVPTICINFWILQGCNYLGFLMKDAWKSLCLWIARMVHQRCLLARCTHKNLSTIFRMLSLEGGPSLRKVAHNPIPLLRYSNASLRYVSPGLHHFHQDVLEECLVLDGRKIPGLPSCNVLCFYSFVK